MSRIFVATVFVWAGLLSNPGRADTVQFDNGDTISGSVVSLSAERLVLKSDVLGELTVPRKRVATIFFGDARPSAAPQSAAASGPSGSKTTASGSVAPPQARSVNDAVEQLRRQGVSGEMMDLIQKAVPLLKTSPEAQKYFGDRVKGLSTGDIDIGAVRNDAKHAINELESLKKDLGPNAATVLDPYLGILKKFVRETDAPKPEAMP